MILQIVVCSIGIIACMLGMRRIGYKEGLRDGIQFASIGMLREFCIGSIRVEDGKVIIDSKDVELYTDKGERITEMSLEDLEFEKV